VVWRRGGRMRSAERSGQLLARACLATKEPCKPVPVSCTGMLGVWISTSGHGHGDQRHGAVLESSSFTKDRRAWLKRPLLTIRYVD
jgi:hypothetical protein